MRHLLWLVILVAACSKQPGVKPRRTAGADSADQIYGGMTTFIIRDGVRKSRVTADSAWSYQARQVIDLKKMTLVMFDTNGAKVSTITADKGVYHPKDQSLDARGHVVATNASGKVLKTEHLIYDNERNVITSDSAFTSTSPKENVSGSRFTADPGFKQVKVDQPKMVQKGKGILLPGQRGAGK